MAVDSGKGLALTTVFHPHSLAEINIYCRCARLHMHVYTVTVA